MATAAMLARGETLGGYRIDDLVGVGGMAIVYRAEQLSLGRTVALKVLAPALSRDAAFRERFRREGRHAAALDHPNVVTIYDSGEVDGRLYLAMRLVEGTTLAHRIAAAGVSPDAAAAILTPIASALDAAHELALVHRDIKPANILLDGAGTAFLADFGLATRPGPGAAITSTGGFVGSVHYAPPEQIRGEPATARGDIYALAAVLYQCLTGEVPYPYVGEAAVMHAQLHDPPPRIRGTQPGAERVARVIACGMAKDPEQRYRRAGEMARELSAAIAELPPSTRQAAPGFAAAAVAGGGRAGARRAAARRVARRRLALAAAVAAIAGAGVAAVLALAGGSPARARAAAGAPIRLPRAAAWRAAAPAAIDTLALTASPISLRSGDARLTAGPVRRPPAFAAGPPPALVARLGAPATRGSASLAGASAHRYTWPIGGGRLLAATVLATTRGEDAVLCDTPAADTAAMLECLATASGARLRHGRALAPGPLEPSAPAHAAGAIEALDSYWDDIAVGDYAAAYGLVASGVAGVDEPGFVANERRAGITQIRFRGTVAAVSMRAASIEIATLRTRDAQTGCHAWAGRYELTERSARWAISIANIAKHACAA